jgi:twitching motility protein PilT
MIEREASELYLYVGSPPVMRIHGELQRLDGPTLTPVTAKQTLYDLLTPAQRAALERDWQLDYAYSVPGVSRFRVSISLHRGTVATLFRTIPRRIPTVDELGLPPGVRDLCLAPAGLLVVSGPAGSGKTTTLAAMIDHINEHRECTILTVEDPIEYLHRHKRALIGQQEIGMDAKSFGDALRQILRQHPDVVLIGTLLNDAALTAGIILAETGHLALTSVRASRTIEALKRLLDFYPPDRQEQIAQQLAVTLSGVVGQVLLPRKDGAGRVAAFEILRPTPEVQAALRTRDWERLAALMADAPHSGLRSLPQSLADLVAASVIDADVARQRLGIGDESHEANG